MRPGFQPKLLQIHTESKETPFKCSPFESLLNTWLSGPNLTQGVRVQDNTTVGFWKSAHCVSVYGALNTINTDFYPALRAISMLHYFPM